MIYFRFHIFIIFLITKINLTKEEDVDECLYAIPREKYCFKIPKNELDEYCCYLEMDLNQITTTACVRAKNEKTELEKRIFQFKENEDHYTLDNLKIKCFANHIPFSIVFIIFNLFFFI